MGRKGQPKNTPKGTGLGHTAAKGDIRSMYLRGEPVFIFRSKGNRPAEVPEELNLQIGAYYLSMNAIGQ
ncbi:hypothetical protein BgiMline_025479, partial [Biomphalaria glabrata]